MIAVKVKLKVEAGKTGRGVSWRRTEARGQVEVIFNVKVKVKVKLKFKVARL